MKLKVLPKGTELTCPKCGRIMVRANCDIDRKGLIRSKYFDPVEARCEPKSGMHCPFDETPFARAFDGVEVHTKDGWV